MGIGSVITSALRHRIAKSGGSFMGHPVEVLVNNSAGLDNNPERMSPETMWQTQPHLRTVVDFLSRNVAQLGLHCFIREGDERHRNRESVASGIIDRPNAHMTTYDLVCDLVGNLMLHNRAYWFIFEGKNGTEIHPFPAYWVAPTYKNYWEVESYTVSPPDTDRTVTVPSDQVVAFNGWTPNPGSESSPVETLRLILEEQHHARKHRVQLWRRNGRVGSYITRPETAPEWSGSDRRRFLDMFEAFVGDNGSRSGGTPILEDGMDMKSAGFKSADEEWAESVKLSLEAVAQVYQVNPTMVGVLDQTNYSNVKEFNRSLYTNTLGPLLRFIEQRLNTFVLPLIGGEDHEYFEFNVEEKLRGSFEEQASIGSTAVGGPWMTRNEFRAMRNLPPLEGGDELVTPLNVTEGGQTSPQDGEEPSEDQQAHPVEDPNDTDQKAIGVVRAHIGRVARIIPSKGFDRERFVKELAADLKAAGCSQAYAEPVNDRIESIVSEDNRAGSEVLLRALDVVTDG